MSSLEVAAPTSGAVSTQVLDLNYPCYYQHLNNNDNDNAFKIIIDPTTLVWKIVLPNASRRAISGETSCKSSARLVCSRCGSDEALA